MAIFQGLHPTAIVTFLLIHRDRFKVKLMAPITLHPIMPHIRVQNSDGPMAPTPSNLSGHSKILYRHTMTSCPFATSYWPAWATHHSFVRSLKCTENGWCPGAIVSPDHSSPPPQSTSLCSAKCVRMVWSCMLRSDQTA